MLAALQFMADQGLDLVVTSGGLGPTADDLTAEVVGRFCGREMVLDPDLEERICRDPPSAAGPPARRRPGRDPPLEPQAGGDSAGRGGTQPVGTAPGLVVPPADAAGPTVVVLPGPPRELQPMWEMARATPEFTSALPRPTGTEHAARGTRSLH
jgi:nicotinamide-nucleotide amidase